jgi:hypothetical protein
VRRMSRTDRNNPIPSSKKETSKMILPPRNFAAAASQTPILPLICRPSLTPANSCASRPTPQVLGKANTLIVCIDLGIYRDSFHQCLNVEPYALSGEPMRMQHKHKKPNSATPDLPPSPTDTRPTKRASRLFLLLLGCTLDLRRTSESLLSVLALLACIHFVSTSPISRKAEM